MVMGLSWVEEGLPRRATMFGMTGYGRPNHCSALMMMSLSSVVASGGGLS